MKEYKGYSYSQQEDTYVIYTKEGKDWIIGFKTEEDVKKQIDKIVSEQEVMQKGKITLESIEQQVTNLELALTELYESEVQ